MANLDIIIRAQNLASNALRQVEGQLNGIQRNATFAERGMGGLQRAVGVGMVAAAGLAVAGVGALAVGLARSVTAAADFESQINVLTVAARSSGTSMADLSAAALQVGSDSQLVGISASEAADAMTNFYKAGLDTGEIMGDLSGYLAGNTDLTGALRTAIDLAAASELDLAQASDVVAVSMATFGLEASDAARIADVLVGAADASLASVGGLADALINVGPAAAAMGIPLEDAATALALLSTRGIAGSEAGTALRSMLLNLQRPTKDVQATLDELGVSLYDAEGNFRALPDVIASLEGAMAGLTEEQRQQVAVTLAGSYGLGAFNVLVGEGTKGWTAMAGAVDSAATAQEVAAARTQGFKAATEQLKGALETFLITVGMPLIQNFLTPAAQGVGALVTKMTEMAPSVEEVQAGYTRLVAVGAEVLAHIAAVVGPIAEAVGQFVEWQDVLVALGLVVASMVIPALVGIVAAAAPVIAVGAALVASVALVRTAWENDWGGIQEKTATVVAALQEGIGTLAPQFAAMWAAVEPILSALAEVLGVTLVVAGTLLLNGIQSVMLAIVPIVGAMVTQVTAFFETLTALWKQTVALIQAIVDGDWTAAWAAVQAIVQVFADYWAVTLGTLLTIGATIFTAIKDTVVNTLTDLGVDVAGILTTLQTTWQTIWQSIQATTVAVVGVITGVLNQIVVFVTETVPVAIQEFSDWLGKLSLPNPFTMISSTIADRLNEMGITTPTGAGQWQKSNVQGILRLLWRYAGYGEVNRRSNRPYTKAPGNWPPILTEEEAQSVENERKRRVFGRRGVATAYLFSGVVHCAECGARMVYATVQRNRPTHHRQHSLRCPRHPAIPHRHTHISEPKVRAALDEAIAYLQNADNRAAVLADTRHDNAAQIEAEIAQQQSQATQTQEATHRADDAFVSGRMDTERYQRQVERLAAQAAAIAQRLAELAAIQQQTAHAERRGERLEHVAASGPSVLAGDTRTANAWLKRHLRLWVEDNEVTRVEYL